MEGTKGLARGNGFAARFLIAAPESTQGTRLFREGGQGDATAVFGARLRELLGAEFETDEHGALMLPALQFDAAAFGTWRAFHDDTERELRAGGDMADVRDVASKAADNVARLAALFHLYVHGAVGPICKESVASAASIVSWHLYEARRFLGDVSAPRERANAGRLDAWLIDYCRRECVSRIERRRLQQYGPNAVRSNLALAAALAELIEAGRVRQLEGGKLIAVNPALLGGDDGAA
jgi:putative DNA primase/helicase